MYRALGVGWINPPWNSPPISLSESTPRLTSIETTESTGKEMPFAKIVTRDVQCGKVVLRRSFFMATLQPEASFLNAQGAPLYYEVAGQGYPLLLIHAGVADSSMWDEQFEVFAGQYKVIRYDLRGFGKSEFPAGLFANHEDPAALLKFLNVKRAHVIGISFGGKIALDFTLVHPE